MLHFKSVCTRRDNHAENWDASLSPNTASCPHLTGWQFSPSMFSKCNSLKSQCLCLHNLEELLEYVHSSLLLHRGYGWYFMQIETDFQRCKNGAKRPFQTYQVQGLEVRRIFPPQGSSIGSLCDLGQVTWPLWTLLNPFLEKGVSRSISRFPSCSKT